MGSCGMTPGLPGSSVYLVPLWVSAAAPSRPLSVASGWQVSQEKRSEEGLTLGSRPLWDKVQALEQDLHNPSPPTSLSSLAAFESMTADSEQSALPNSLLPLGLCTCYFLLFFPGWLKPHIPLGKQLRF